MYTTGARFDSRPDFRRRLSCLRMQKLTVFKSGHSHFLTRPHYSVFLIFTSHPSPESLRSWTSSLSNRRHRRFVLGPEKSYLTNHVVFMTVQLRTPFFRDVTPGRWRFEGKQCLHLQGTRDPDLWTLEVAATTFLRNAENRLPNDAVSYPNKTKSCNYFAVLAKPSSQIMGYLNTSHDRHILYHFHCILPI